MAATNTILVVDDDPLIVQVISEILSDEGYRVRTAATGEAALAVMHADAPDLVIIDFRMPGMDGLAVVQTARDQGMHAIRFVLLTADTPMELREQIGLVDGYVFKPFDITELLDCIARCLRAND